MVWRLPEVSGHRRVLIMAMRAMKAKLEPIRKESYMLSGQIDYK